MAKVKTQATKNLRPKKPKIYGLELIVLTAPPYSNNSEFSTKAQREKKENSRQNDQ